MHCSLPPHRETLSFTSYEDYEVHYLQNHVNRCSECSKNFPVGHLLNVHIEENHDPLIAARRARGEKTVSFPKLWPPNCYTMTPTKTNYSMDALSRTASGSAPLLRNGVSIWLTSTCSQGYEIESIPNLYTTHTIYRVTTSLSSMTGLTNKALCYGLWTVTDGVSQHHLH